MYGFFKTILQSQKHFAVNVCGQFFDTVKNASCTVNYYLYREDSMYIVSFFVNEQLIFISSNRDRIASNLAQLRNIKNQDTCIT